MIYAKPDDILTSIAKAAFPDYNGKSFRINIIEAVNVKSYWDGGSRSLFTFVSLTTGEKVEVPSQSAFDKQIQGAESVNLPEGVICVEHKIFCGKDLGLVFHIPPINAAKFLPTQAELSWEEKVVLSATRSLKSSYSGISNYRKCEAMSITGIPPSKYDEARERLAERGLLNKAGAITVEGRNAIGLTDLYSLKVKTNEA